MQPGPRPQYDAALTAERIHGTLVGQRESNTVDGALEQHEQPIGTINQLPVPALLQPQYQAIVLLEQFGCGDVADAFDQLQRIAQVSEQQCP